MTPADAAFVLEPLWQAFAVANLRLGEVREKVDALPTPGAVARHVNEVEDATAYLQSVLDRFLCSESGGLMTVLEGRGRRMWPNVYPASGARQRAEVFYFARRFEAELAAGPKKLGRTA